MLRRRTVRQERLRKRRMAKAAGGVRRVAYAVERQRERAAAEGERARFAAAQRERQLAFGLLRELNRLPALYATCLARWPELRIYTPLSGTGRRVVVEFQRYGEPRCTIRPVGRPIAELDPVAMSLVAVARSLEWLVGQ